MIAFACPVGEPDAYRRYAEPGIRRAAEPGAPVLAYSAVGPMARACNLLLDHAARLDGLEALVLVHPHAEIADPGFAATVRATLADPEVAIAGCAGATGVGSLAWWDGRVHAGRVEHAYSEHGGGRVPAFAWADPGPVPADVDAVDGFLMVLSPWAVRELRFDEALHVGPGFDTDYCLRARRAGRRVVAADLAVVLHRSLELCGDPGVFTAAHLALAEKWDGWAAPDEDWKARARRAEAERESARAEAYFRAIGAQVRLDALRRELDAAASSPGWRLTAPLRVLNARRRARRG